ncbi:MAG TPA: hypothetical protein VLY85_01050 [Thermoplasmata archaeon]|nr:hypothetical protein [Thermoplasmata archaeon]
MASGPTGANRAGPEALRDAESALARMGFSRIPAVVPGAAPPPEFWVREAGVPRRAFPVFVEPGAPEGGPGPYYQWMTGASTPEPSRSRAIVVVPSERAAREAWSMLRERSAGPVESELAILVLPDGPGARAPYWHRGILPHRALLRLATGIAVGLYYRAQASEGGSQVEFTELLDILKTRFLVDVAGSLGVDSDEDALFILYQLAVRDAYAPGDPGSSLHLLVLKPTGPAARIPWFAA